jgi:hypothetical protein
MSIPPPAGPSITESPWFWGMLFCLAGLLGTLAIGPKYSQRQAQLERKYQGRQRAAQVRQGQPPTTRLSEPETTRVRISPVQWGLALGLAAGWFAVWRVLRRRRLEADPTTTAADS